MQVNDEIKRIFFSPPKELRERIQLFIMLVLTFILFFQPLQFSAILPREAFLIALMPSATLSWGWIVFLRYRKGQR